MKYREVRKKALEVLEHQIDVMAGYWSEVEYLSDGLTSEEIEEVQAEVYEIARQIRKRYGI